MYCSFIQYTTRVTFPTKMFDWCNYDVVITLERLRMYELGPSALVPKETVTPSHVDHLGEIDGHFAPATGDIRP